jgi:hypothetical protein
VPKAPLPLPPKISKEIEKGGVLINLISREMLDTMSASARVRFIVDEVKQGKVLVLERGLNAVEEMELIRLTMSEIDHESFIGVETPGFSIDVKRVGFLRRLLGRRPPPRMMVVGPADIMRTIRKDGHVIQAMILTRSAVKSIREDLGTEVTSELPEQPQVEERLITTQEEGGLQQQEPQVTPPQVEPSTTPSIPAEGFSADTLREWQKKTSKFIDTK